MQEGKVTFDFLWKVCKAQILLVQAAPQDLNLMYVRTMSCRFTEVSYWGFSEQLHRLLPMYWTPNSLQVTCRSVASGHGDQWKKCCCHGNVQTQRQAYTCECLVAKTEPKVPGSNATSTDLTFYIQNYPDPTFTMIHIDFHLPDEHLPLLTDRVHLEVAVGHVPVQVQLTHCIILTGEKERRWNSSLQKLIT